MVCKMRSWYGLLLIGLFLFIQMFGRYLYIKRFKTHLFRFQSRKKENYVLSLLFESKTCLWYRCIYIWNLIKSETSSRNKRWLYSLATFFYSRHNYKILGFSFDEYKTEIDIQVWIHGRFGKFQIIFSEKN